MDRAETIVAVNRIKTWPREWQRMMLDLPASEATVVMELVALLDARPCDDEADGKAAA